MPDSPSGSGPTAKEMGFGSGTARARSLDAFIVIHDGDLLLACENAGRFDHLADHRYVFVGPGSTDHVEDRDDVIIARWLPDNIERYPHLLSFTAWYAIARNDLARSDYVAVLEYDVNITEAFEERTLALLRADRAITGYLVRRLTDPVYLHATPWFIPALQSVYGIDAAQLVRNHLAAGGIDQWTPSTNLAMTAEDLSAFVDWFMPLTPMFREEPIGAHVHERAVTIFCLLNGISNTYVPGVLEHGREVSHGIPAVSDGEVKARAAKSPPLVVPPTNKDIVLRYYREVIENRNQELIRKLFAGEIAARIEEWVARLYTAFDDLQVAVHDQIAESDRVVSRIAVTGVHSGGCAGGASIGRAVCVTAIQIHRLEAGQIVEQWEEVDLVGLRNQLE